GVQTCALPISTEFDRLANSGGTLVHMPYWEDLTGDDEVLSDQAALTPGKITAGQDVARRQARGRAWGVNDLAHLLAGDDPMRAIGDLVAEYWARRFQRRSEEHTSELQSRENLVCRLLLEKKNKQTHCGPEA